ncbi:hypothetical protein BC829DRAFT_442257 [Chytridium lagenaria]|nr:hypothetical protein BC829DRAFT_442257 [Chytridium lagenaria]
MHIFQPNIYFFNLFISIDTSSSSISTVLSAHVTPSLTSSPLSTYSPMENKDETEDDGGEIGMHTFFEKAAHLGATVEAENLPQMSASTTVGTGGRRYGLTLPPNTKQVPPGPVSMSSLKRECIQDQVYPAAIASSQNESNDAGAPYRLCTSDPESDQHPTETSASSNSVNNAPGPLPVDAKPVVAQATVVSDDEAPAAIQAGSTVPAVAVEAPEFIDHDTQINPPFQDEAALPSAAEVTTAIKHVDESAGPVGGVDHGDQDLDKGDASLVHPSSPATVKESTDVENISLKEYEEGEGMAFKNPRVEKNYARKPGGKFSLEEAIPPPQDFVGPAPAEVTKVIPGLDLSEVFLPIIVDDEPKPPSATNCIPLLVVFTPSSPPTFNMPFFPEFSKNEYQSIQDDTSTTSSTFQPLPIPSHSTSAFPSTYGTNDAGGWAVSMPPTSPEDYNYMMPDKYSSMKKDSDRISIVPTLGASEERKRRFSKVEDELKQKVSETDDESKWESYDRYLLESIRAGNLYRASFMASIVFGVYICWDAIMWNIIQIIGVILYSLGLCVFSIVQVAQANQTIDFLLTIVTESDSAPVYVIIGLSFIWLIFIAATSFELWKEFGWGIYRRIGGDISLEKSHGGSKMNTKLISLTLGLFFLLLLPILGYYSARKENTFLLFLNIFLAVMFSSYVIWRIFARVYSGSKEVSEDYDKVKLPVTLFGMSAVALLVGVIGMGLICWGAFGKGLKEVLKHAGKYQEAKVVDLDS